VRKMEKVDLKQTKEQEPTRQLPFILGFLEYREGAMAPTTCGIITDIDAYDAA